MNESRSRNELFDHWRMMVIYIIIGAVAVFYVYKLFRLQIIEGSNYVAAAADNATITNILPAPRGIIYDRNGVILASNVAQYNVTITPANLPGNLPTSSDDLPGSDGNILAIYRELSTLIGVPVSSGVIDEQTVRTFNPCQTDFGISQIVYIENSLKPYQPVRIKCDIDEKTAMIIKEKASDWPGVDIESQPIRQYPTGGLTSEIIGFLGRLPAGQENNTCYKDANLDASNAMVGYAGIEAYLQCDPDSDKPLLSGTNGSEKVQVDGAGQQMGVIGTPINAVAGTNIRLTIDTRLQEIAKVALQKQIDTWNLKSPDLHLSVGAVIAINPKTGEILALASNPTYENDRMDRAIPADYYNQLLLDPAKPMFNHAISAEEAPGSVFKLAAGLGVLNEGVVTPDYKVNDPGKISLTEKFYPTDPGHPRDYYCWIYKTTGGGHGMVDFLHGMGESCDVYWYKVGGGYENEVPGNGLGILRLAEYAKALGYGQTTGIELPGESSGNIPDPTWKRLTQGENWSTGDTYISTIGQGYVTATALQVLMSYVTLANNGQYVKPTLIKDYLDSEGRVIKTMQPTVEWDITKDPMIAIYDENDQPTYLTDANGKTIPQLDRNGQPETDISGNQVFQVQRKTIAPWVVKLNQQAMRFVVTDGTAKDIFVGFNENGTPIDTAGKTGTAEYCDDIARAKNLCQPNNWPSHAWYVGYAPYQNPEIAVVAFVYNGQEGATVAAPIVRDVLQGYFDLKSQK